MNGGGEIGEECEAVASTAVPLPHMDLVAMSNSETSPVPSRRRTARPATNQPASARTAQPAAPSYSAGTNDDFALIEDEGDLPF